MFIFSVKTPDDLDAYLAKGGDLNQQNHIGQTLLHKSVIENNAVLTSHILNKNGVKFLKDTTGKTPIYYVSDKETATKMLFKGASIGDSHRTNPCCASLMIDLVKSTRN